MIDLLAGALLLTSPLQSASADGGWTWTLYADDAPVVLAHEVPDTARLRTTFECEPGGSVARLTLYGVEPAAGMARLAAGEATAVAETAGGRDSLRLALRTDHPVFAAFAVDGRLSVTIGDLRRMIEVPPAHLARLRRFAELCAG